MGKIIDVDEVQRELNRAARDARHGTPDVRAGRFVHRDARGGQIRAGQGKTVQGASNSVPNRKGKPAR